MCDTRAVTRLQHSRRDVLVLGFVAAGVLAGCAKRVEPGTAENLPGPKEEGDPLWAPQAKAYLVAVPPDARQEGDRIYPKSLQGRAAKGLVALKAACPFDGVRVSWCRGDRFFSCPGCGSVFTRYGDCVRGPSSVGLARFDLTVNSADEVVIDRALSRAGAPTGVAVKPVIEADTSCRGVLPGS